MKYNLLPHPSFKIPSLLRWFSFAACFFLILSGLKAQPKRVDKFVFFPDKMEQKWITSVGITAITPPYDITEEFHFRVPAADVRVNRRLSDHLQLNSNATIQGIQNELFVGLHYQSKLNDRFSVGVGDDIGYWLGFLHFSGFKSEGSGWENKPGIVLGYKVKKRVLLTLKGEALFNFGVRAYAGDARVSLDYRVLSGSAYSFIVEQPFFKKTSLAIGLRAIYTDFFWQTWPAFESFNRNLFYPQIIIALIP